MSACPVCGSEGARPFLEIASAPVLCNQLYDTAEAARSAAAAPMELACCAACGHVFNTAFRPELVRYGPDYENALHHSGRFREYAAALVGELASRHRTSGGVIVEVGCGDGDFLRALCRETGSTGLGFDPSHRGDGRLDERVSVTPRALEDTRPAAALLCCRHCLEHVAEPLPFLAAARAALAPDGAVYFEVPNALATLERDGIWDLIYEHCAYFTPSSLRRCFAEAGFGRVEVSEAFGGQFLQLHARLGPAPARTGPADAEEAAGVARLATDFAARRSRTVERWRERVGELVAAGRRVVAWGAGSKGATFLNALGPGSGVDRVVDINPLKDGRHVVGTGQRIVSPERLVEDPPDFVVVMNGMYLEEIRDRTRALGLSVELACA